MPLHHPTKVESRISRAEWISRLTEPAFRVIIADPQTNDTIIPIKENEWVLSSNLYGPDCHHQPHHHNPVDCHESSWYLAASFVSPKHRGGGMLREAFLACEEFILREDNEAFQNRYGRRSRQFRTRILGTAHSKSPAIFRYYESVGLKITETVTAAHLANWGWMIALNPDMLDKEFTIMEKVIPWEPPVMAR